jgi:hypothetical protein
MEITKAWLTMLLWGPFVSIGIGFVLPAFGLFLFLRWLMLLLITIVSSAVLTKSISLRPASGASDVVTDGLVYIGKKKCVYVYMARNWEIVRQNVTNKP